MEEKRNTKPPGGPDDHGDDELGCPGTPERRWIVFHALG